MVYTDFNIKLAATIQQNVRSISDMNIQKQQHQKDIDHKCKANSHYFHNSKQNYIDTLHTSDRKIYISPFK